MTAEAAPQTGPSGTADGAPLLEVEHLRVLFPIKSGVLGNRKVAHVHAVDDVTFELHEGETLGVVGESGCGKTTLIRTLVRLIQPTAGAIRFHGEEITGSGRRQLTSSRAGSGSGSEWPARWPWSLD